jgi:hypothetical protein
VAVSSLASCERCQAVSLALNDPRSEAVVLFDKKYSSRTSLSYIRVALLLSLILILVLYPAVDVSIQSSQKFETNANHETTPALMPYESVSGSDPLGTFWSWLQKIFHPIRNFFQEYVGHVRPAWADSAGPRYPSTCVANSSVGSKTWNTPSYAQSSDNSRALSDGLTTGSASYYLWCTVFGFSVTAGATINGVVAEIEHVADYSGRVKDYIVALVVGGSVTGSNYASGTTWSTSEGFVSYGGSSNLWGTSLTASQVNASNFGMVLSAIGAVSAGGTAMVDSVRITIYYTAQVTITWALSGVSNDATGTIIAIDGTNYVYADFPKAFSWVPGSTKSVAATDPVSAGTGKQYDWTQWTNGDGLSGASGTYTVPGSAITVTAVYATQWYLTVTSTYDSPTGQAWYTNGNSASSTVTSPVSGGSGVQYVCTGWTGTGSAPASGSSADTGLFSMSAASSVTWNWVTQYQVTFTSSVIGADTAGTVVTVNGTAKTQAQLPFAVWYNATQYASYAFSSPVAASAGKQYLWSSTSGLSQTLQSNIFVVSGTGTVTGTYYIQWQISITQSGIAGDTGATTIVVVDSVNKAAGDLPFTAWYNNSASISYTYTLNVVGSSFQYVWVSTSGCGQTARSATFSATASGTLTGNYGVLGGTATVTTTVIQTTTTGTTATATTTTATTATTTATYTSVTVAVTLTSQTITSITISTSYTSLTLPPGLIPNQPNYNQAALGVDGLILVMNQTQIVYADITIRFYGSGEFLIDNVEFQEPLGEVHWVTLNETMQGSCSCYKQVAGTDSVKLRVKLAPGLDIQPGVHVISMLVQGKTSDGLALGNTGWLAVTVTSILPAQAMAIPSPTLTQASAAVSAGVTLLVLIGTAMRRPKDSAGA